MNCLPEGPVPTRRPARSDAPTPQRHREMLIIAVVVVAASFLLRVGADDRVAPLGVSELTLPPLCLSRAWFGFECPGCGLTRSFVYLAHGEWQASWAAHRLGWLLAVMVVLQIPYRIHGLCRPGQGLLPLRLRHWITLVLIGLLIGNWVLGLLQILCRSA